MAAKHQGRTPATRDGVMMFRFIGYDKSGIKRVWGEAESEEDAIDQCQRAIAEYAQRRPDCLPMCMWREPECAAES
jgi:hypothetical protein